MKDVEEQGLVSSFHERVRIALIFFLIVVSAGTLGYRLLAGSNYSIFDCFYMTMITISTVGFGEVIDLSGNTAGRLFTIFLIFSGMGCLLYVVSTLTAFIVEGEMLKNFWRRKMDKMIKQLSGHYILCGGGRQGFHIIQEFTDTHR